MSRDYGGGSPGFIPKIRPWDSKSLQRTDATPRSPPSGRCKFRFANCFRVHFGPDEPRLCSPKTRPWAAAPTRLGRELLHLQWERSNGNGRMGTSWMGKGAPRLRTAPDEGNSRARPLWTMVQTAEVPLVEFRFCVPPPTLCPCAEPLARVLHSGDKRHGRHGPRGNRPDRPHTDALFCDSLFCDSLFPHGAISALRPPLSPLFGPRYFGVRRASGRAGSIRLVFQRPRLSPSPGYHARPGESPRRAFSARDDRHPGGPSQRNCGPQRLLLAHHRRHETHAPSGSSPPCRAAARAHRSGVHHGGGSPRHHRPDSAPLSRRSTQAHRSPKRPSCRHRYR